MDRTCQQCNGSMEGKDYRAKFCGRDCFGLSQRGNANRTIHGRYSKGHGCVDCNGSCTKGATRCMSCHGRFKLNQWLQGKWDGNVGDGLATLIRRHLIAQAGNACEKCGWNQVNEVTGNVPVQVNHIDGDAYNNTPTNLEVLCPNCHSLTPNYGSLNKTGTRVHRRKQRDGE